MGIFLISILCSYLTSVEEKIQKLAPDIKHEVVLKIGETILNKAPIYGFSKNDEINLILAMAKTESGFKHIFGSHGEVGMLQVIPEDPHIMEIVSKISCEESEFMCKNGTPDVFKEGKLASYKVRKFLSYHPYYALETGIGEMKFWRDKYFSSLKQKYWTKFPRWYFKTNLINFYSIEPSIKWWWENLTKKAGDLIWISHYNWGNKISTANSSRNYALRVLSVLETI